MQFAQKERGANYRSSKLQHTSEAFWKIHDNTFMNNVSRRILESASNDNNNNSSPLKMNDSRINTPLTEFIENIRPVSAEIQV